MSPEKSGPRSWLLTAGLVAILPLLVGAHFVLKAQRAKVQPLEVLGTLPDFKLTDQQGKAFTAADLDGKLWVVDFFFTRCSGVCPLLYERMKEVRRFADAHPRFASRIGLLSITVDPTSDTPERLGEYAKQHAIDPTGWRLATGPAQAIEDVVVQGFHVAMGQPEGDVAGGRFDILHGTHLVLVDDHHRIRGYFDGDPAGVTRLERDLGGFLEARDKEAQR